MSFGLHIKRIKGLTRSFKISTPPPRNLFKINCDGAYQDGNDLGHVGIITRGSSGAGRGGLMKLVRSNLQGGN